MAHLLLLLIQGCYHKSTRPSRPKTWPRHAPTAPRPRRRRSDTLFLPVFPPKTRALSQIFAPGPRFFSPTPAVTGTAEPQTSLLVRLPARHMADPAPVPGPYFRTTTRNVNPGLVQPHLADEQRRTRAQMPPARCSATLHPQDATARLRRQGCPSQQPNAPPLPGERPPAGEDFQPFLP